ncbi:uncharacterized protein LTR77_005320 [Saxophila tyrrhenica]|uniref:Endo-chitosanase n=1 Tax=Saxophila tyrrhenica TaxID=1690608 RepID=A0AAV9PCE2_9PEZI|nr:hypothetical protein LTR77_005320 [Saxophila tyrrhenica]
MTAFEYEVKQYSHNKVSDLNANYIPYVVFGNYGSTKGYTNFDPQEYGLQPLSVMAVVCGDHLVYGVWGDTNGDDGPPVVGEASISLATACFGDGITGNNGHDETDVLFIAFPGSEDGTVNRDAEWGATDFYTFEASIEWLGDDLVSTLCNEEEERKQKNFQAHENSRPSTQRALALTHPHQPPNTRTMFFSSSRRPSSARRSSSSYQDLGGLPSPAEFNSGRRSSNYGSTTSTRYIPRPTRTYTIKASICQHPIRESTSLPWSGSTLDFDVRYCRACENSNRIRDERREAESSYTRSRAAYDAGTRRRSAHKEDLRRYDRARIEYQEDLDFQSDRDDRERRARGRPTLREEARAFAGKDDPEWLAFKNEVRGYPSPNPRHARFDEAVAHRRESQYRPQKRYRRDSRKYRAGSHSDTSGLGFWDTSNVEVPTRSQSPRRESSRRQSRRFEDFGDEDGYQDYLDTFSSEQLQSRKGRLERDLERLCRR